MMEDLANESRDVDMRGAGPCAWGVEAIEAARGFDPCPVERERRRESANRSFKSSGDCLSPDRNMATPLETLDTVSIRDLQ